MQPAIFLDRDGTIIVDKNYLNSPEDVEFLPYAIEGLREMIKKGYLLVVVTNQSGVSRGLVQEKNIDLIHKKMDQILAQENVKITSYYYNIAAADSNDRNRKPNPGMLLDAIKKLNIDVQNSWMIGDRQSDIEAGMNAQVRTIFIENSAHSLSSKILPWYFVANLKEAAKLI